jgi:hypothetical protein
MSLTVTVAAPELRLTTVEALKADLGDLTATNDCLYDSMILRASSMIDSYCHRAFARQTYTEVLPGRGNVTLRLAEAPVATVTSVTWDSNSITDYSIDNAAAGILYRQVGWPWTVQYEPGLGQWGVGHPYWGIPIPGSEMRDFTIVYTAGYLLPSQNLSSLSEISASQVDNSFNHSASGFPALLKAGDVITVAGFTTAANNGRHIVSGTPTAAKIVVSSTLVTEVANTSLHKVNVSTLPPDVEAACLAAAKLYYGGRKESGGIVEKQLGSARLRFSESSGGALPAISCALLSRYVRSA